MIVGGSTLRFIVALAIALSAAISAHAAPPPLEAYGRLPAIEDAALSPSGARFALLIADKDGCKVVD